MLHERRLLTGGMLAGVGALMGSAARVEAAGQRSQDAELATAIHELAEELRLQRTDCRGITCTAVDRIRENQKVYFKGQGRFPDVIEVGYDIWASVWDWLVRTRQKPEPVHAADGRWTMAFMLTTLVLRHDIANDYVSVGYDR